MTTPTNDAPTNDATTNDATTNAATRPPEAARRPVGLALLARFTDELLYGAVNVLLPTMRGALGLSYAQVGALSLALDYVAYVINPMSSLLIDVWRRRWLLAAGACSVGAATMLIGVAPTFVVLLLGFALYGTGAGPLAQTADVVLVESHTEAPTRIFARATALDTLGALLGPALVAVWLWLGLEWRWLLVGLGTASLGYAALLARTRFPDAAHASRSPGEGLLRSLRSNLAAVLADREAVTWLVFLRVHYAMEAPLIYRSIWLAEEAGMSQSLVAAYVAFVTGCSLLGVLVLERGLGRLAPRRILIGCLLGLLVLFPAWFIVPGVLARFALGAPLAFLFAMIWPVARSSSLTTASRRPGAVSAINSLTGLLPVTFGVGLLAELVGLTAASLGVHLGAALVLLLIAWRWLPRATARTAEL